MIDSYYFSLFMSIILPMLLQQGLVVVLTS